MYGWYKLGKLRGYENGLKFNHKVLYEECEKHFEHHKRQVKVMVLSELLNEGKIKVSDVEYHEPQS